MRIIHEVERGSNLDLILRGTNGAVNKLADAIGRGLTAIALALSTPQDNSAQVQAEIDKLVAQLNAGTAEVQDAINKQQKGE
jgi:formiminotetrahydrofolate cyclodeaminase